MVVGCINEVVVLTGYFLLESVLAFCWAKKIGRNNEVVALMRWSYGGVPLYSVSSQRLI